MPITGNQFPKHETNQKRWKTISSSMSVCRFAVAYIYKSKMNPVSYPQKRAKDQKHALYDT